ncbi:MAG: glycosyltransferase family 1 protein [Patescibacteria group bacterium]
MRIGIDARLYKAGLGIGRYIEQLLLHLEQLQTDDEYVIFLRKEMMNVYMPTNTHFKKVCIDIPWYSLAEQCIAPIVFLTHNVDIMHFPHFNVPIFYPKKFVLTLHDLIMIKHAESSKSAASTRHPSIHALKYAAYLFVLRSACRRARAIIAVSDSVKNDIMRYLTIPQERLYVVHEGVQLNERGRELPLPPCVRKPYCINVGNAYPHKNIGYLLTVFEKLKIEGSPMQLVLCGQEDYFKNRVVEEIKKRGLEDSIVHLGYVSDDQLAILYRNAHAALFPSLEEGFGFGPLEAALLGTPVIVSHIPVFQEILGTACLYIDPLNPCDMIDALKKLDTDVHLRNNLITRGQGLLGRYSWKTNAFKTSQIYHTSL